MKEFWIYTGLRLLLFAAAFAVVFSAWLLAAGEANWVIAAIVAFLLSGLGSYVLLDRQRAAFARRVEARAERMSAKLDEMRSKEDTD